MFTFEPRLDSKETVFKNEVKTKFDLYNSLFLTLPFYQVKNTGLALPYFFSHCENGILNEQSPEDIIESFFKKQIGISNQTEVTDLLFRFIQYIERQVVLFDAVEDAAYSKIRVDGENSLDNLMNNSLQDENLYKKIQDCLREFKLRLVLTAHPTQFYPGPILSIMTDLTEAIKVNDVNSINLLLKQLGKTPFFNKQKPTPVDEALSLNWFLENILYQTASDVHNKIEEVFKLNLGNHSLIELGFWPGGDRDGNPYVTADTTRQVSASLRETLFRCYYRDFRRLKRRITFIGTDQYLSKLEEILYANAYNSHNIKNVNIKEGLLEILRKVRQVLIDNHDGLFIELVEDFIWKVKLFGCHFASLDIRQDSRVLRNLFKECITSEELKGQVPENYFELSEEEKIKVLPLSQADFINYKSFDSLSQDSLDVIRLIKGLQEQNGKRACHRFIISNCQKASDILQLKQLFLWSGWKPEELDIDFVPLFETIDDLKDAYEVMDTLYSHPIYKKHLERRRSRQVIMLGFSDSTKDGGYLMANYSIYYAKSTLTDISRKHNIDLAFFDGRGGPPARGGGKTHKFYASFGKDIANKQIQITVQGQTISSYYGTFESSTNNMEQLIHAGIDSALERQNADTMNPEEKALFSDMADVSYEYFMKLREHPLFLKFMENQSPLKMLSQINIGSRPVKRNGNSELKLEDLRAISFVTSWSQVKMNIPGFYGVGSALKSIKERGDWEKAKALYKEVGFFKTVIDNCMMSMSKADFRLTQYLSKDKVYGEFWKQLKNEYDLTKKLILELSDSNTLMEKNPIDKMSISLREKIVLPLVIIQRYAIIKCTSPDVSEQEKEIYNKLAMRTIYGIINAARNSA